MTRWKKFPPTVPSTTPTHGHFVLSPVSLAARGPRRRPAKLNGRYLRSHGKIGDCELLVNCEPKNPLLEMDSPVPLTRHDPKDLGLICSLKKRKIHFRIFLKKRTLIFESDVKGEALHCKARFSGLFGLSADQFQYFRKASSEN